jgi:hypothetical protein
LSFEKKVKGEENKEGVVLIVPKRKKKSLITKDRCLKTNNQGFEHRSNPLFNSPL